MSVAPGKTTQIELTATPTDVSAGTPIHIVALAKDAYGNHVPSDAITLSSSPKLAASYTPVGSSSALMQGFVASDRFVFATIKDAFGNVVSCPSGAIDSATLDMVSSPQEHRQHERE